MSMELRDVLQQMIQENTRAGQPTDLRIGTVTKADPLEITINTQMAPLRAGVLLLTECVVEKKIPILQHTHEIHDTATGRRCWRARLSVRSSDRPCRWKTVISS